MNENRQKKLAFVLSFVLLIVKLHLWCYVHKSSHRLRGKLKDHCNHRRVQLTECAWTMLLASVPHGTQEHSPLLHPLIAIKVFAIVCLDHCAKSPHTSAVAWGDRRGTQRTTALADLLARSIILNQVIWLSTNRRYGMFARCNFFRRLTAFSLVQFMRMLTKTGRLHPVQPTIRDSKTPAGCEKKRSSESWFSCVS